MKAFISKMVAKYPKLLSGLPTKDSGVKLERKAISSQQPIITRVTQQQKL